MNWKVPRGKMGTSGASGKEKAPWGAHFTILEIYFKKKESKTHS